jgi:hypothetical protein
MENTKNVVVENEVVVMEDVVKASEVSVSVFENTNQVFFSSIKNDGTRESAIKMYQAINDAENSLSDHLGEVLEITDMVAHAITLQDDVTKEDVNALRVVLIDKDGVGYHSVSSGVVSSLQKVIGIVGQAPWTPALKVVPVEKKTRKGFKTLTIRLQA